MEELEITAPTVEEATRKAEKQLGISRDQFEAVVVKQGKPGIFGMGGEESIIRVKPLTSHLASPLKGEEIKGYPRSPYPLSGEGRNRERPSPHYSLSGEGREGKDIAKVATEVLKTLLRLTGVTGVVEASSSEIPVSLNIEGDDLGILIGRRGKTLSCLQYLVRLIVAGQLKAWLPLNVDVCGYKKRRRDSLQRLALRLAEQVELRHHAMTLEPMPPDERRIIHLALANHPDVVTHSIGEGEDRKVVILLKRG